MPGDGLRALLAPTKGVLLSLLLFVIPDLCVPRHSNRAGATSLELVLSSDVTADEDIRVTQDESRVIGFNYTLNVSGDSNHSLALAVCATTDDPVVAVASVSRAAIVPLQADLSGDFSVTVRGVFLGRAFLHVHFVVGHNASGVRCGQPGAQSLQDLLKVSESRHLDLNLSRNPLTMDSSALETQTASSSPFSDQPTSSSQQSALSSSSLSSSSMRTSFSPSSSNPQTSSSSISPLPPTVVGVHSGRRYAVVVLRPVRVVDTLFQVVVIVMVALMNVGIGCHVQLDVVKATLRRPFAPIVGLCSQFIIMPLLSLGVTRAFQLEAGVALGFLALGCSPGGSLSNIFCFMLRGDVSLSVTMTFISTLAALGLLPLWLYVLGGEVSDSTSVSVPFDNIFYSLLGLVGAVGVGMILKWKKPAWAAVAVAVSKVTFALFIVFMLTVGVYANLYIFSLMTAQVILAAALLPYAGFLLGGLAAFLLRMSKQHVITIAIETGMQNSGLAILLMLLSLEQPDADLSIVGPAASSIFTPIPLWIVVGVLTVRRKYCLSAADTSGTASGESPNGDTGRVAGDAGQGADSGTHPSQPGTRSAGVSLWKKLFGAKKARGGPDLCRLCRALCVAGETMSEAGAGAGAGAGAKAGAGAGAADRPQRSPQAGGGGGQATGQGHSGTELGGVSVNVNTVALHFHDGDYASLAQSQANSLQGDYARLAHSQANSLQGDYASLAHSQASSLKGDYASLAHPQASSLKGDYASLAHSQANSLKGDYASLAHSQANSLKGDYASLAHPQASSLKGDYASLAHSQASSLKGDYASLAHPQANSLKGDSASLAHSQANDLKDGGRTDYDRSGSLREESLYDVISVTSDRSASSARCEKLSDRLSKCPSPSSTSSVSGKINEGYDTHL